MLNFCSLSSVGFWVLLRAPEVPLTLPVVIISVKFEVKEKLKQTKSTGTEKIKINDKALCLKIGNE